MTAPIARAALTTIVVAHLVEVLGPVVLVGRGLAPPAGGWVTGQPGTGAFRDYVTVKTSVATTPIPGQPNPLGRSNASWECTYNLTSAGALESHADDVGDMVRAAIYELAGPLILRGVSWSLQKVQISRLGATNRTDSTDPPSWEVTDTVSLWLSMER
jgi:hypothetical protein